MPLAIAGAELTPADDRLSFSAEASDISWNGERVIHAAGRVFEYAYTERDFENEAIAFVFIAKDSVKLTIYND